MTPRTRNRIKVILTAFISTLVIIRVEQLFSALVFDIGNLFALINAAVSGLLIGLASRSAKLALGGGALGWLFTISASVLTRSEVFPSLLLLGQHTFNELFLRSIPLLASLGLATLIGYLRRETTIVELEEEMRESTEVPAPKTIMRTPSQKPSMETTSVYEPASGLLPGEPIRGEEFRSPEVGRPLVVEKTETPTVETVEKLGGFPETKVCGNCSRTIPFESIFCSFCGRRAVD